MLHGDSIQRGNYYTVRFVIKLVLCTCSCVACCFQINDTVCMCYIIQLIKLYLINNVHICIGVVCVYDKFVPVTPTMFQFFDKKHGLLCIAQLDIYI